MPVEDFGVADVEDDLALEPSKRARMGEAEPMQAEGSSAAAATSTRHDAGRLLASPAFDKSRGAAKHRERIQRLFEEVKARQRGASSLPPLPPLPPIPQGEATRLIDAAQAYQEAETGTNSAGPKSFRPQHAVPLEGDNWSYEQWLSKNLGFIFAQAQARGSGDANFLVRFAGTDSTDRKPLAMSELRAAMARRGESIPGSTRAHEAAEKFVAERAWGAYREWRQGQRGRGK